MKKKLSKISLLIIIIILIIGSSVIAYKYFKKDNNLNNVKVVSKIDGYKYKLTNNKTALYKKYFVGLRDILEAKEIDDEKYAKQIVKLFIADFYDLDSKISKTDIGGLDYIYPKALDNFKLNAQNTMYKYIENNVYNNRTQLLPVVKSVTIINSSTTELEVDNQGYIGYQVEASWLYDKDLGYQNKAIFDLVKIDKYYYIIKTE